MTGRSRVNDGSRRAPRLEMQMSWWAMTGAGKDGREETLEEKFERIAEAGYQGVVAVPHAISDIGAWRRMLDRYNLSFGLNVFADRPSDLTDALARTAELRPIYVTAMAGSGYMDEDEGAAFLYALRDAAAASGVPLLVETHRGRLTQDLLRTLVLLDRIPDLTLTIDLSHYMVCGEMGRDLAAAERWLAKLLPRTGSLHGRISNGQQIQIAVDGAEAQAVIGMYERLWTEAMTHWLDAAEPGDLLPVLPELGPPPYAMTLDGGRGDGSEWTDRWEQSLRLKRMLEACWLEAVRRAEAGQAQYDKMERGMVQ